MTPEDRDLCEALRYLSGLKYQTHTVHAPAAMERAAERIEALTQDFVNAMALAAENSRSRDSQERSEAIELAAKICEQLDWGVSGQARSQYDCAEAIRAALSIPKRAVK